MLTHTSIWIGSGYDGGNSLDTVEIALDFKLNIRYYDVLSGQECACCSVCCSSRGMDHNQRPRRPFDLREDQRVYETSVLGMRGGTEKLDHNN